jgi:hypothetical protein
LFLDGVGMAGLRHRTGGRRGDHQIVLRHVHSVEAYPDVAPLVFHNSRVNRLLAA